MLLLLLLEHVLWSCPCTKRLIKGFLSSIFNNIYKNTLDKYSYFHLFTFIYFYSIWLQMRFYAFGWKHIQYDRKKKNQNKELWLGKRLFFFHLVINSTKVLPWALKRRMWCDVIEYGVNDIAVTATVASGDWTFLIVSLHPTLGQSVKHSIVRTISCDTNAKLRAVMLSNPAWSTKQQFSSSSKCNYKVVWLIF